MVGRVIFVISKLRFNCSEEFIDDSRGNRGVKINRFIKSKRFYGQDKKEGKWTRLIRYLIIMLEAVYF